MQSDKLKTFSEEKVFNLSELHFSKVTSYKIHILVACLKVISVNKGDKI